MLNNTFHGKIGDDLRFLFKTLAYARISALHCYFLTIYESDHKDVETNSAYGYSCEYAQMTTTCMSI